jgi:NitT/TauT family transport system substrate-binding protein
MKTIFSALLAASLALGATAGAWAKDTMTFGYLADPSQEVVLWALKNGKVSSDTIEIEATPLDIPALLQATPARTYDVIMTAAMALPRAMERGLDLRILATSLRNNVSGQSGNIWVPKDSPIRNAKDLKGKTVAVLSIGSAAATLLRISLNKSDGLNVAIPGGDINFVELPPPAMPPALATGKIDAAQLSHIQAYQASKSGDFIPVVEADKNLYEVTKLLAVSAVLAGYEGKLDASPDNYREFLRLLRASRDYALANPSEVFPAVAANYKIDPDYFATWFANYFAVPLEFSDQDKQAVEMLWREAKALAVLPSYPTVDEATWSGLAGN